MQLITERAYARLIRSLDEARQDANEQRAYNRTLVQTIVEMRREGFVKLATPPASAPTQQQRARQSVEEVINMASQGDRERARILRVYAASQRAEGKSDDAIADELLKPIPADEEGVPA